MKFTKEVVDDLADKLLIGLTEEENKMVLDEFEEIDKAMEKVCLIKDIEKVEPMRQALDLEGVLAEDIIRDTLPIEDVLKNAAVKEGREIEVPKVVG